MPPSPAREHSHSLIIGGTGMLRGVSLALAQRGQVVSVVAQSRERLTALARDARASGGEIHPLMLNYGLDSELREAIASSVAALGPIRLAIAWIHDDAPRALPIIAAALRGQTPPARLFDISGSPGSDPALVRVADGIRRDFPDISWKRIVLGFTRRDRKSHWLSHEQICRGVLDAIDHDWDESVIGVVRPREERPN